MSSIVQRRDTTKWCGNESAGGGGGGGDGGAQMLLTHCLQLSRLFQLLISSV